MIRGEITLQRESKRELALALRLIAASLEGGCNLDDPEGEQRYGPELDEAIITAAFKVLPEYREGDLDKFIGCLPDATGNLGTEEYIDKIRGRDILPLQPWERTNR